MELYKTVGIIVIILISLTTAVWGNVSSSNLMNSNDSVSNINSYQQNNMNSSTSNMNNFTLNDLNESVSIMVTGNANFGNLVADNILSSPQPINIKSTSNVPVNIDVKAVDWSSDGGNMPLSALKFGNSHMDMTTDDQTAITNLESNSTQNVNLYMKIPFGSLSKSYSTTITWTATAA